MKSYQVRMVTLAASLLLCLATSQVFAGEYDGQQIGEITSTSDAQTDQYAREIDRMVGWVEAVDTPNPSCQPDPDATALAQAARADVQQARAEETATTGTGSRESVYKAKCKAYGAMQIARAIARNRLHGPIRKRIKFTRLPDGSLRWKDAKGSGILVSRSELAETLDRRMISVKGWVIKTFEAKTQADARYQKTDRRLKALEAMRASTPTTPTPVAPEATVQPEPPAPAEITTPPTATAPVASPTNRGGINWTKVGWIIAIGVGAYVLWLIGALLFRSLMSKRKSSDRPDADPDPLSVVE